MIFSIGQSQGRCNASGLVNPRGHKLVGYACSQPTVSALVWDADIGDSVLTNCKRNVEANRRLRSSNAQESVVHVRALDWDSAPFVGAPNPQSRGSTPPPTGLDRADCDPEAHPTTAPPTDPDRLGGFQWSSSDVQLCERANDTASRAEFDGCYDFPPGKVLLLQYTPRTPFLHSTFFILHASFQLLKIHAL